MVRNAHLLAGRPIYFPYLSGVFEYDCASCSAPCCRGAQLGIGRSRELVALLSISPALALCASPEFAGSPMPALQSPIDACWFLDQRTRCRLEWAVGRENKPASCRLFPFQQVRGCGEYLVVMPHFLCPLVVADVPHAAGHTSHDEICLEMHRAGVPRDGHLRMPEPPDMPWHASIPLERRVRDLGARHLDDADYAEYAQEQEFVTYGVLGETLAAGNVTRLRDAAVKLLSATNAPSMRTVRMLVALTPYLRLRGVEVPRRAMPYVLTALSVLLGALESIPGTRITLRSIVQLFEHRLPLLYVLGHLAETPRLQAGYSAEQLLRGLPHYSEVFMRLLKEVERNAERKQPRSLAHIIAEDAEVKVPLRPEVVAALWRLGRFLADAGTFAPP